MRRGCRSGLCIGSVDESVPTGLVDCVQGTTRVTGLRGQRLARAAAQIRGQLWGPAAVLAPSISLLKPFACCAAYPVLPCRYGVWADWQAPYVTLDPAYEAAQLHVFGQMVLNGHIYRGRKPVHW